MRCSVYENGSLQDYKFVVIFAVHEGKWLLCKHKERDTWENAGGHIEVGETPLEAAKRELFEETGAVDFEIEQLCEYRACADAHEVGDQSWENGVLFFARIHKLGDLPESEMECIRLFEDFPENLTYHDVMRELIPYAEKGAPQWS